jgi:hypothetical protein
MPGIFFPEEVPVLTAELLARFLSPLEADWSHT